MEQPTKVTLRPPSVAEGETSRATNVLNTDDTTILPSGQVDPVYEKKAKILNRAVSFPPLQHLLHPGCLTIPQIQDIGMGAYQHQLTAVIAFGWASDNLWPIVTSLIFTPIKAEFSPRYAPLLTLAQNIGLLAGALFWGFGCDVFGRRWAFNLTLGVTAAFGMAAAGANSFAAIGTFAALWSFGVGGNLPVDSAIYLEFLPATHQYLLTVLSVAWALAQVVATLVACKCYLSLRWVALSSLTLNRPGGLGSRS
jgi:hypothetical protein